MCTVSLILARVFVLAGCSMAGSAESGLAGIGAFAFDGSPITVPRAVIGAVR